MDAPKNAPEADTTRSTDAPADNKAEVPTGTANELELAPQPPNASAESTVPLPGVVPGQHDSPRALSPPATRRGAAGTAAPPQPAVESVAPPQAPSSQPPVVPTPLTGDDCGQCAMCLDKPRFGGPGIKRKACLAKRTGAPLRAPAVIESVVKPPALDTTPSSQRVDEDAAANSQPTSQPLSGAPPSTGAGPSSSSLPGSMPAPAHLVAALGGARKRGAEAESLRERVLRKTYSLRQRGAEAGEQILMEPPMLGQQQGEAAAEEAEAEAASAEALPPALLEQTTAGSDAACMECDSQEAPPPAVAPAEAASAGAGAANGSSASGSPPAATGGAAFKAPAAASSSQGEEGGGGDGAAADDGRSPLNELLIYKNGVPCTPQLKTPEIEALASGGALGMSPLSEFASLLDMTPRLPVSALDGVGIPPPPALSSPLWQLASLMERTPRLPDTDGKPGAAGGATDKGESSKAAPNPAADAPASSPSELGAALLNGGLESPAPSDTPGQLRRDLHHALLQASALATPQEPGAADSWAMPPPPPKNDKLANNKARKRKLEGDLGLGNGGLDEHLGAGLAEADGDERLMLRELLEGDSLGLPLPPLKKPKTKKKEVGKPMRCRCDRSGCLKRYCVCFAAGNPCVAAECKCKGCENDDATEERKIKRLAAVAEMQKKKSNAFQARIGPNGSGEEAVHLTGCNCKRSGCQRRYCECFQAGVRCTEKCKWCARSSPFSLSQPTRQPTRLRTALWPPATFSSQPPKRLSSAHHPCALRLVCAAASAKTPRAPTPSTGPSPPRRARPARARAPPSPSPAPRPTPTLSSNLARAQWRRRRSSHRSRPWEVCRQGARRAYSRRRRQPSSTVRSSPQRPRRPRRRIRGRRAAGGSTPARRWTLRR